MKRTEKISEAKNKKQAGTSTPNVLKDKNLLEYRINALKKIMNNFIEKNKKEYSKT